MPTPQKATAKIVSNANHGKCGKKAINVLIYSVISLRKGKKLISLQNRPLGLLSKLIDESVGKNCLFYCYLPKTPKTGKNTDFLSNRPKSFQQPNYT